jgi:outer membrane receptor protein involved in Fe transport
VAAIALTMALPVQAQQVRTFNVPAEDAAKAIPEFARQAGVQLLAPVGRLHGVVTPKVSGVLEIHDALRRLLTSTSLEIAADTGSTIILRQKPQVIIAPSPASGTAPLATLGLAEVIVTATKRPEAVRKIAGSVSAVTGAQLEAIGANSFADYLTSTPGVVFNAAVPGQSTVTIRGVSSTVALDQGQGTTGYFINDVPLTDPYYSVAIPDIDAFDVDNVSVLRGPQGTLFGSASLGGAIDYQAAKPNLSAYQAHIQGTVDGVDGGGTGGSGKAMINLPLIADTLAVRGVYVYRDDAGFIDNIGTGVKNSNETLTRGARIEATWTPTAKTTINYLFLNQIENTKDQGDAEPLAAGSLKKTTLFPESFDFTTRINNLRLDQDLGFATLTATATYHEKTQDFGDDYTDLFAPLVPGAGPVKIGETGYAKGSTFEVRLASPAGQRFEYVVGAFYDITREYLDETISAPGAAASIQAVYGGYYGPNIGAIGAPGNTFFSGVTPFKGKETAVFGEATFHLNDQWKVTFGGREFETQSNNVNESSGFYELISAGTLSTTLKGSQDESGFTPKGSITWTPNQNVMAYALVSKGFRFGGPNINPSTPAAPIPPTFGSDSLINYEVGTRTNWFGDRLQLDATAFYIDWSNIQLRLYTPAGLAYAANAGRATNYGLETTGTWRIASGLTFQSNLTYLDARLSDAFNPGGGGAIVPKGSTLPGASKWQVSSTLSYDWAEGPFTPTFLLTNRFISDAPGNFSDGVRQGGYDLLNGRITGHFKTIDIALFVDNIANSHGITSGANLGTIQDYLVTPRTVGITFDYKM